MQNLLLLHGAMGAAVQLQPLKNLLQDTYTVHTLDFYGHGGQPVPENPFVMDDFVQQAKQFIEKNCGGMPVLIFGYSMGGYAAMRLAQLYPGMVHKAATLSTKYQWTPAAAGKEIQKLQPEAIEAKVPKFAGRLAQLHGIDNWKPLMRHTAALLHSLGQNNVLETTGYGTIQTPALLMTGDRDMMATAEETMAVYRQLPAARLSVLPATPHPLEKIHLGTLRLLLNQFFDEVTA